MGYVKVFMFLIELFTFIPSFELFLINKIELAQFKQEIAAVYDFCDRSSITKSSSKLWN